MEEIEKALKDSLQRQIAETKKQIASVVQKTNKKNLENRRIRDQLKARLVLSTLKLKKDTKDFESLLEDHRKQWSLDHHRQERAIIDCSSQLIKWKYSRILVYEQISDILKSAIPNFLQLFQGFYDEEETTARVLLDSAYENSESSNRNLQILAKLEAVRREILLFLTRVNRVDDRPISLSRSSFCSKVEKMSFGTGEENIRSKDEIGDRSGTSSSDNLMSLNSDSGEKVDFLQEDMKKNQKVGCCERILACFKKSK